MSQSPSQPYSAPTSARTCSSSSNSCFYSANSNNADNGSDLAAKLGALKMEHSSHVFCEPPFHSTMTVQEALVAPKTGKQRFYVVTQNNDKLPLGVYTSWCASYLLLK